MLALVPSKLNYPWASETVVALLAIAPDSSQDQMEDTNAQDPL